MKRPSWLWRLVPYLGRRQAEEDLQEELRLHLELERERQREAESMVLSLSGGVLGLAAASIVLRAAPALIPVEVARLDEVGLDAVVLVFTVGLSIVVGLLFGAAPVFQWTRVRLVPALNEGGAQSAGGFRLLRSNRTRAALATAQVALTLVLLIGAGLLLRSFVQLVTFDRGYDPINAVTAAVSNPVSSQPPTTPEAFRELQASHHRLQVQLLDEMTTRLERFPDIEAFGLSWSLPFAGVTASRSPFRPAGTPMPSSPDEFVQTWLQVASPGYLEAMGFRLRAGRTLTRLDGPDSPRVLVANETLARELFGGEPAVGRRVLIGDRDEPWEVIGIVEDIVYGGLELTAEPRAEAFFALAQIGGQRFFGFRTRIFATIRTSGDSLAAIPFLREAATAANPQATLGPVMTMEARLSDAVAQPRLLRGLHRIVRGDRLAPGRTRHLWPAQLHRGATQGRDRDPHGARRPPRRHCCAGGQAGCGARGRRGRHRSVRRGGVESRSGESSVRRRHQRTVDVHRRASRGRGGRARRLLAPRSPGGPRRSGEDATLRIGARSEAGNR